MPTSLSSRRLRSWTTVLAGGTVLIGATLVARRMARDREAARIERLLSASAGEPEVFTPGLVTDLPEPARRYLLHAIADGTPLSHAVRLRMEGTMVPNPGGRQIFLRAEETIAPRRGFVWTAHTRLFGVPARVRDHYFGAEGGVRLLLLGLLPVPFPGSREDITRSSRGRLIGEAVWCPTVLVAPEVTWEAVDADRARFTFAVDGEAVSVTLFAGSDGRLREVTLSRWGNVGVPSHRMLPYGFAVEDEETFGGITIPTRLRGGWWYGTERFDPTTAATFRIRSARFFSAS